jgi:hypothetical protein
MKTPDPDQIVKDREAFRKRLDEFEEAQKWAHHVADLSTRKVQTTTLSRPVAPLTRARRLSQLGLHLDTTIFNGPSYQLTPRRPYLAQPESWLIASVVGDYSTLSDFILWQVPRDATGALFQQLQCFFNVTPERQSLVSISISGKSRPGKTGFVRAGMSDIPGEVRVPIGQSFASHTIDIVFDPVQGRPVEVFMVPTAGIEFVIFRSIILRNLPPVLTPG